MNWIYRETDYRNVILKMIEIEGGAHGLRSKLARAAGCQPAYFSQMLAGQVHLTPEHASSLIDYWQLEARAGEYFLVLVHIGRAGTPSLKQKLNKQAEVLAAAALSTERRIVDPVEEHQASLLYYSHWRMSAIHVLLAIKKFQDPKNLATQLKLSPADVERSLAELERVGLAQRQGDRWIATLKNLHVDTPTVSNLHHGNWRNHSQNYLNYGGADDFHFTNVCTLSEKDFYGIRKTLCEVVEKTTKVIEPSEEQLGACMIIDWYKI